VTVIVVSRHATPARRWLAHLVRAANDVTRPGDRFGGDLPFDEEAVWRLALRQRVAPLLHRGFTSGAIGDRVPLTFRRGCERAYYATLHKNSVARQVADEVLSKLAEHRVAAAPLEDWAWADAAASPDPDPGARPMDDLDFIVREADRERAEFALGELGFRRVTRRPAAVPGGHDMAFHLRRTAVDVFVELHWAWAGSESLMRPFDVSGDRFLDALCVPAERGLYQVTRLGHLLFGAVHAASHDFARWIWLIDLHHLVSRAPIDWAEVVEAARIWRARRPLYAGLLATRELLRTAVPSEVLAELSPGPLRRSLLHRSLAVTMADRRRPRTAWAAKLLLGESWWDVARTAAWAAAPGSGWYGARARASGAARRLVPPPRVLGPPAGGR
jgi:hypothetical protein